jgi:hypothetical protein
MPEQAHLWEQQRQQKEAERHVEEDFAVGPAGVVTAPAPVIVGERVEQPVKFGAGCD